MWFPKLRSWPVSIAWLYWISQQRTLTKIKWPELLYIHVKLCLYKLRLLFALWLFCTFYHCLRRPRTENWGLVAGCPKEFNRADKLKSHIITHSGIKPFKCSVCGKGFSRRPHMLEHERGHKSDYRFKVGGGGCTLNILSTRSRIMRGKC